MKPESVLQSLGLTETEVKAYLALLKSGELTASALAARIEKNRTFTYECLRKLASLGLVSHLVKENRKYFRPAPPSQLLSILREREEQVQSILPALESLKVAAEESSAIEIYSSKKGVRTALNLILKEKTPILIHGSLAAFEERMGEYFTIWNQRRKNERISAKILSSESYELELCELRLLPEEERAATTTFTAGEHVVIVLWSATPVALSIRSQEIAREQAALFSQIWEREVRIYDGRDGVIRAWMELVDQPSKELVGFGLSWMFAQIYGRQISDKWHALRLKNRIPARLIAHDEATTRKYFDVRMMEWQKFGITFLDPILCGPACVALSDRLVVTFLYTEKKLRVIVSSNPEMISVYRRHFEELWKRAKRQA